MSLKKGDKVRIKKCEGDSTCKYLGKETVITKVYKRYDDTTAYELDMYTGEHWWNDNELELIKENAMSKKYYRVLKDTPLWNEGAILALDEDAGDNGGYRGLNDLWDKVDLSESNEYLTGNIVEDSGNADFFERVYPLGKLEKMMFGSKKQAQAAGALYKGDKK